MTNPWVQHLKTFSKDNGISYMCALSNPDAKASYVKPDKKAEQQKKTDEMNETIMKRLKKDYIKAKEADDETKIKFVKSNFNKKNKEFQQYVKSNNEKLYKLLIFTKKAEEAV